MPNHDNPKSTAPPRTQPPPAAENQPRSPTQGPAHPRCHPARAQRPMHDKHRLQRGADPSYRAGSTADCPPNRTSGLSHTVKPHKPPRGGSTALRPRAQCCSNPAVPHTTEVSTTAAAALPLTAAQTNDAPKTPLLRCPLPRTPRQVKQGVPAPAPGPGRRDAQEVAASAGGPRTRTARYAARRTTRPPRSRQMRPLRALRRAQRCHSITGSRRSRTERRLGPNAPGPRRRLSSPVRIAPAGLRQTVAEASRRRSAASRWVGLSARGQIARQK